MMHNSNIEILNSLSHETNELYGFVNVYGDNFGEPAINSWLCAT